MPSESMGSSMVVLIAAVLWFAYLVPTWLRRRQYLATERDAVRLQQTLRILAETTEIPEPVRAHRSLRADQARRIPSSQNLPVEPPRSGRVETAPRTRLASSRRIRRGRLFASAVLLCSVIAAAFGAVELVIAGNWLLLVGGAAGALGSFLLLGQMATMARARQQLLRLETANRQRTRMPLPSEPERPSSGWTPVPLPKPLYLSRPPARDVEMAPPPTVRSLGVTREELLEAAAQADRELRAVPAPRIRPADVPPPAPVRAPSRFAAMGVIHSQDAVATDLDEVLRRRRAVSG